MVLFCYLDSEDLLWAGTSEGIFSLDTKKEEETFIKHNDSNLLDASFMFEVSEDRFGNHVIGTNSKGLLRWNRKTESIYSINSTNGMPTENIFRTFGDKDGNIWLSPYGKGMVRFTDALFTQYTKKEGISNPIIKGITSIGDSVIVGTSGGLFLGIKGKYTPLFPEEINSASSLLKDSQNRIWYTAPNNIGYIENGQLTVLDPQHEIITQGNDLCEDNDGNIFICTWGDGIWKYSDHFEKVIASDSIILTHTYSASVDAENNLWVATFGYGSLQLKNDSYEMYSYNKNISTDKVYTIKHNNGKTYAGTNGAGLIIIENGKVIHQISKADGLLHNSIVSVHVDGNTVWCGTVKGMNRIEFLSSGKFEISDYSIAEGFKDEPMLNAIYPFQGQLLIGTGNGLTVYNPAEDKPLNAIPGIVINAISLDFGKTPFQDYCSSVNPITTLPNKLALPYSVKRISFRFEGISLNYANELEYAYRLKGMDENFSPLSKGEEVTFNELKPGEYTFEVYATAKGKESKIASYSFEVLKPFWEEFWFLILVLTVITLIIYVVYMRKTAKLRNAKVVLENTVQERTKELVHQKEIVEEKNSEILDSINYARRIQSAILPPTKIVKEYLQNSFILYKPKDVVAGDFYWMEHSDGKVLYAAADCTGHGVPGAMISVVCNNALNRAVREYGLTDPGQILDKTREIVINEFEQSEEDVKDGMDIALCCLEGQTIKYAGAHNPLWIIRNGEVLETKADKEPIGKFDAQSPYTTHTFELQKNDSIYIFSDGYYDQFGGERGKKLKTVNFKKLLLSIQDKSMEDQREILLDEFNKWKGNIEQIDDVCVIGVRI